VNDSDNESSGSGDVIDLKQTQEVIFKKRHTGSAKQKKELKKLSKKESKKTSKKKSKKNGLTIDFSKEDEDKLIADDDMISSVLDGSGLPDYNDDSDDDIKSVSELKSVNVYTVRKLKRMAKCLAVMCTKKKGKRNIALRKDELYDAIKNKLIENKSE
jgi:hypothetical protein